MADIQDVASARTHFKCSRLRGARVGSSVCQYCAVGCSQLAFLKDDVLIDVEGDPRSPVNEGRQCPKGATIFALNDNPYRATRPLYRAPGAKEWKEVSLDWMIETIAQRAWATRERGFVARDDKGMTINRVHNMGFVGGSANDNEECYLFRKLMTGGLGILPVENTARYCHSTTVAALAPTFGFGACTNPPRDLLNSDCIVIMGSNMAEAHPVAFYWPMQAKKKGATTIHIDPRYTRTSAACDHHVPIRPATDIAFLSGVIRYILENDLWFRDYVLAYTNASTLIDERFHFDDVAGLFNGWDPQTRSYSLEPDSWDYQYEMNPDGSRGKPKRDPTLQDPHCVFQLLKHQVAKYTPEIVADICGCRPADVIKVAEFMGRNSGPDKTTAFCYATGFTQHSTGTQIIRTVAILQLLLGNIGRPGGGILALRGHSNVQGATDIPTLFGALPNYIPMPEARPGNATLADYLANGHGFSAARDKKDGMWKLEAERGSWAALPNYMVSLLKAWYGEGATEENEYGYQWMPKLTGNDSLTVTMERMLKGEVEGLFVFGQNIAVTNPNTGWSRDAVRKLKWLVVCDLFENETASAWYADPTAPDAASDCETEVFLLPAATVLETDGSVTNTERLMQWHERCKPAPGLCRSDGWWVYQLGKAFKKLAQRSGEERDAGLRALTWDYDPGPGKVNAAGLPPVPDDLDMDKVAFEMNGYTIATGAPCQGSGDLRADGTTACGCRLLSGFIDAKGNNLMKREEAGEVDHEIDLDYRFAWPTNSRILYNRCSARPDGCPWSEKKRLIWWDADKARWVGYDKPQFDETKPPDYEPAPGAKGGAALGGADPFTVHSDGRAWLFVPYGIKEGPFPAHYEPVESPYVNPLWKQDRDPGVHIIDDPKNPIATPGDGAFPTVMTTYHMVEHWLSGSMTRHIPWLVQLQPQSFVEMSPEQAKSAGVQPGALIAVASARTVLQMRALITPRLRIGKVEGREATVVGGFVNSGYKGVVCDPVTNDLSPAIMAPDGLIPASKGFAVRVTAGSEAAAEDFSPEPVKYPESMTKPVPDTPWPAQPEGRS
ncbi:MULTISPECIES: formate dehydrogenase-N subunit alpha [unclassified Desulfovibrio]|uniref:formate dehydrogenase-N subunit alpha n=1 Tax=unclassified Desulfovibrio TaxID=2593640 RepID=UPI0013ECEC4D|nr:MULTISPECIES: formate dehydrogenase-N subunit alpha [unclassified Desulfovibrio]